MRRTDDQDRVAGRINVRQQSTDERVRVHERIVELTGVLRAGRIVGVGVDTSEVGRLDEHHRAVMPHGCKFGEHFGGVEAFAERRVRVGL